MNNTDWLFLAWLGIWLAIVCIGVIRNAIRGNRILSQLEKDKQGDAENGACR